MIVGASGGQWPTTRWSDVRAFSGRPVDLPRQATTVSRTLPTPSGPLPLRAGGAQVLDTDPATDRGGWEVLAATFEAGQTAEPLRVVLVDAACGIEAGVGILLLTLALPFLFMNVKNPWYQLLSEGDAGLSLGRVQLLLWFVPALFIYSALSLPLLRPAPLDPTLSALLGLGGFTTLLSTAASKPSAPASEGATTISSLPDLVTDFDNQTDLTRYQYLAVSALGSFSLLVSFIASMTMPSIPKEFLYLVAASQAAYVGTKAVKATRTPSAQPGTPPGGE